ncbi:unnamed protein product, partial [marine sediment metagenome]
RPFSEEMEQATTQLGSLNIESEKLRTALISLKDVTGEAAQIQKTLNALEAEKKARFDVAQRFAFGTQEDRQGILRDIKATVIATAGQPDLNRVPSALRQNVLRTLQPFGNARTALAGVDPETGQLRRASETISALIESALAGINVPIGAPRQVFGPRLSIAESDPTKLNAAQEEQVGLLKDLFDRRAAAEKTLLENMGKNVDGIEKVISTEFQTFTTEFIKQLAVSLDRGTERKIKGVEIQRGAATEQLEAARKTQSIVRGAGA